MMEPSSVRYRTCCHNLQRAFCKDRKKFQKQKNTLNSIIFYKASLVTKNYRAYFLYVRLVSLDTMKVWWGVKACLHASLSWTLVRGEFHATAALCLVEEPLVTIDCQVGGFQRPSGHFGEEKNIFLLMGIEARSLVTKYYALTLWPWSWTFTV